MIFEKEEVLHDFGKWAERRLLELLASKYNLSELNSQQDKYSRIDAVLFHNYKLTPIQVKARAPRALYKDISIKRSQFDVYKQIAEKNGGYIGFFIIDTYNPEYGLDYLVYRCNFLDVKYSVGQISSRNSEEVVYIKLDDMTPMDILPIEFQKQLERKHIEMIRPKIGVKYIHLYKNKFKI